MSILEQIKKELPWLDDNLSFDLTRGKPSADQLKVTENIIASLALPFEMDGIDLRNYGIPEGIPSARQLGSEILSTPFELTLALDNSSLTIMQQVVSCALHLGFANIKLSKKSKFICPVPGYDRHFKLLENFGIEMVTVNFSADGPNLNEIKTLLEDDAVSGIVCVPRHSNPTGHTYSDSNISSMFEMFAKKKNNFMILWDNAYACHDLKITPEQQPIMSVAKNLNLENNLFIVGSTSKITLAGAGLAFFSSSERNIEKFIDYRNSITPGPNKINQALHVNYFKKVSLDAQMQALRELILPKFNLTEKYLTELHEMGLCDYIPPTGGYFISFESRKPNAEEIISECANLGLKLLPLGSCFPYMQDPKKNNIRIAPTFPNLEGLDKCLQIFSSVVKKLN